MWLQSIKKKFGKIKKPICKHPNIYKFIELIRNLQESIEINIRLLKSDTKISQNQCKKYRLATEKLRNLQNLLFEGSITPYEFTSKCATVSVSQKK